MIRGREPVRNEIRKAGKQEEKQSKALASVPAFLLSLLGESIYRLLDCLIAARRFASSRAL